MPDKEKVIKGLESCVKSDWEVCMNKVCPYAPKESYNFACCRYKVMEDALELLKEQEAVVRCKDCKHGKVNPCSEFTTCFHEGSCLYGNTRKSDWFCADGEGR